MKPKIWKRANKDQRENWVCTFIGTKRMCQRPVEWVGPLSTKSARCKVHGPKARKS